jgi:putative glycerol-1-phosphate prenyltransferase
VKAAKKIRSSKLDVIPTGYILIDGQKKSTTQKITKTTTIKRSDSAQAISTAIAGEQLGMKAIYLEAGSGAASSVPSSLIRSVKKNITLPLFVGGGIDSRKKAEEAINAGADCVVIGNALEKNIHLLSEIETAFS